MTFCLCMRPFEVPPARALKRPARALKLPARALKRAQAACTCAQAARPRQWHSWILDESWTAGVGRLAWAGRRGPYGVGRPAWAVGRGP